MAERVLSIEDLSIWYKTYRGYSQVVDHINLHVNQAEKVGLVGESGCGKTTTMKTIMGVLAKDLIHVPNGKILFHGKDTLKMSKDEILELRRKGVSMISQSPMSALNPVFTVGKQLTDIIKYSGQYPGADKKKLEEVAKEAITNVMLSDPERILGSYPHQLSGGMRQRICIASAMVTTKDLLIADEPTTALDVTIQDQILSMLHELVEEKKRSLIMITHSLGVARQLVDRIYIMYGGNIIETCRTQDLFENACHPYTQGLLSCAPRLSGGGLSAGIYGYVPDYVNPPKGCRFCPRCPHAMDICREERPGMVEVSPEHEVACFRYGEKVSEGSGKSPEVSTEEAGKAEEERKEGGEGDE
ncbi:ABC transporter ATP-binding protein [Hominifimenecus sp. rT4P-3]|uniref:ABC transporter ATP-binding protein n=1 Tax=Hominifimenecus sp. rT4P-3 TaxID=3242979 RepID=UPI003DA35027